jgi:hypothetical protein
MRPYLEKIQYIKGLVEWLKWYSLPSKHEVLSSNFSTAKKKNHCRMTGFLSSLKVSEVNLPSVFCPELRQDDPGSVLSLPPLSLSTA